MKNFKWTRSVPKVTGYYWVREFPQKMREPHVSILEIRKYGNNLAINNCSIRWAYEDKDIDWAGPIPISTGFLRICQNT